MLSGCVPLLATIAPSSKASPTSSKVSPWVTGAASVLALQAVCSPLIV